MLAGVGCKDYDDDIKNLNDRVNDLDGKIALKADKSAVDAFKAEFDKIDFGSFVTSAQLQTKLDATLATYAKKDDLLAFVKSSELDQKVKDLGYQKKADVDKLIADAVKNFQTADQVKAIFENMLTGTAIMGKIQADVVKLIGEELAKKGYITEAQLADYLKKGNYMTTESDLSAKQLSQILSAIGGEVANKESETYKKLQGFLGAEFGNEFAKYMDKDAFTATMGGFVDDAIDAKLTSANTVLVEMIQGMIDKSIKDELYEEVDGVKVAIYAKAEDLKNAMATYDKQINAIWIAVGNLASRIQSMVFEPTHADGMAHFKGMSLGSKELIAPRFELTFVVSPASLAENVAGNASLVSKAVTRAVPTATFTGDNATGRVTVVINDAAANYSSTTAMAIAIKVQDNKTSTKPGMGEEEDSEVSTGIDFTTAFVSLVTDASVAVDANFVLYNPTTKKTYDGTVNNYSLQYHKNDEVTVMGDYQFMYKDGAEYINVADAQAKYHWAAAPVMEVATTVSKHGNVADVASNGAAWANNDWTSSAAPVFQKPDFVPTVTANTAKDVKVQIKAASQSVVATIGKAFYVERTLKVKCADLGIAAQSLSANSTFKGQVDVIKQQIGNFEFDVFFNWNYTKWSAGLGGSDWSAVTYEGLRTVGSNNVNYVVFPAGSLTTDQFNGIANGTWVIDDTDFTGTFTGSVESKKTAGGVVEGTDAMALTFEVEGYKNGHGTLVATQKMLSGTGAEVSVKVTITVAEPADLTVSTLVNTFNYTTTETNILAANWITTLYNANAAAMAKFGFADAVALSSYLSNSVYTASPAATLTKMTLDATYPKYATNNVAIKIASADFLTPAMQPSIKFADKKQYLAIPEGPFKVVLDGTLNVGKPLGATLDGQWMYLENAKVTAANPKNNLYVYAPKETDLTNYYDALDKTAGYIPTFTIKTASVGTAQVTGGKTLVWGNYNKTSLKLEVALTKGGATYDKTEFDVALDTPLNPANIAMKAADIDEEFVTTGTGTINLFKKITWKDIFDNELVDGATNTFVSDFAAVGCYNISSDWTNAVVKLTDDGGNTIPSTMVITQAGVLTYDVQDINPTKTYTVTVSGVKIKARYNNDYSGFSFVFKIAPKL